MNATPEKRGGTDMSNHPYLADPGAPCERCETEGCPYCAGPEMDYHTQCITCPDCHGTGRTPENLQALDRPCDTCGGHGDGLHPFDACPDCDGTGRHTFDVEAPCGPCAGKGWAWDQSEQIDCPDCNGTGRSTDGS